jgi:pimeloyl-ACP methyl ester carboxylesterase
MKQRLRWRLIFILCAAGSLVASEAPGQSPGQSSLPSVQGRGVTLHYISVGRGEPVVMVHGGLEDYRAWAAQLAPLAAIHYRAITYSRRYNFPNRNATRKPASYSAQVDADDLAMLIEKLHLAPVHLVGHSYGALAALLFATEHPELVRTLTLSEPPVLPWVEEQPGGHAVVQDFFQRCWIPVGRAFAQHKREEALATAMKYFTGNSVVPPDARAALEPSLQEWEVLTASGKAFPVPSTRAIKGFKAPVLLLTGDRTLPLLKRCVASLTVRFPNCRRVTIPDATHDMWSEKPELCGAALRRFLREKHDRGTKRAPHSRRPPAIETTERLWLNRSAVAIRAAAVPR